MAGFRKAKAEQAALKIGVYGPPGSGKTFTALLWAESLAMHAGKRVAIVDTERGSDFYVQAVAARRVHPEAFDVDALYSRSLTDVISAVRSLDYNSHGVVIIDSVTHIWEAAIAAFTGRETKAGTIPLQAWGSIKKPYKALMAYLLSSPLHVIICGRQGNEFGRDEETDELTKIGVKMKAEGETPYEPHILMRFEALKNPKAEVATITAYAEKDRTGILAGRVIQWPSFDNCIKPLIGLLGGKQANVETEDQVAGRDAEALAADNDEREAASRDLLRKLKARFDSCDTEAEVDVASKAITPDTKRQMLPSHVAELREYYLESVRRVQAARPRRLVPSGQGADNTAPPANGDIAPAPVESPAVSREPTIHEAAIIVLRERFPCTEEVAFAAVNKWTRGQFGKQFAACGPIAVGKVRNAIAAGEIVIAEPAESQP